jgi:hypothetical protein
MAQAILFGGGDAGGLIITPEGVRPIPPFDPGLRKQLRAVSLLLASERSIQDTETRRQLASLTNRLTNLVIGEVEAVTGPLTGDQGLIYQDNDGGFTCGTTGKPPIPIHWPPGPPGLDDLLRTGVLDRQVLDFAASAAQAGANLSRLFKDPKAEAARVGVEMPARAEQDLRALNIADPDKLVDPIDREIVTFFHRAVAEGKHLNEWASQPFEVANALGIELSRQAGDRIIATAGNRFGGRDPGTVASPAAIAVVVVIVIVVWDRERRIPVLDRSGVEKF